MAARPIYPVADIRAIEAQALPGAVPPLMERAGAAAAALALRLIQTRAAPVLVACGPGNNGGDGFVMARLLRLAGHRPHVVFAADAAQLPDDARAAHAAWCALGGEILPEPPATGGWALVVDALFGIGLTRPLEGRYAAWLDALNAASCPRLALDIPSGLDADSGRCLGKAFRASHTLSFIALKPGLLTLDGPDLCGELHLDPLGVDAAALRPAQGHELRPGLLPALCAEQLRPRRRNSHKGSYGDAAILGGAPGMVGAALLAARAAAYLGAGRVLVGLVDGAALAVDPLRPELMFRPPTAVLGGAPGACAIGPGLGQGEAARALLTEALRLPCPLLLDADALNLLALSPALQQRLALRQAPTLLTPHPAEAARLLATETHAIQAGRVAASLELARRFNAGVVLKGCGSLLASPDGRWWINTSGNPAMATAGMGDVLCGLIVALLAQGWPAHAALLAGVHLHGQAADTLCRREGLHGGLLADEIAPVARRCFNHWIGPLDHA